MTTRRRVAPVGALCWLVTVIIAGAALAGCTSDRKVAKRPATTARTTPATPSPSSSGQDPQKISFVNCTRQIAPSLAKKDQNRVGRLTFSCGRLKVPLNYANPTGSTTQIYVVRVHDNSQVHGTGSLIVNPGGPGESGVNEAIDLATSVSDELLQHFDIVGFDPRGVFLSSALSCISTAQKDQVVGLNADVRTAAGYAAAHRLYASVAASCTKRYATSLQYFNTVATARDLDLVRQGVGDGQLNYLGYSYGTLLGAVYAHLYPGEVRTAVLDGAVDAQAGVVAQARTQLRGFESAFSQFAAWCRAQADCAALHNPRTTVRSLVRKLDAKPLTPKNTKDTRRVTGAYVEDAAAAALYDRSSWDPLRAALIAAEAGDPTGLLSLTDALYQRDSDGNYTNFLDADIAITCNDAPSVPSESTVRALATKWDEQYPIFGRQLAANLLQCVPWQPDRHPIPKVTASGSAPILVIGSKHDPATPYVDAPALAAELKTGVLLTWDGQGHTAYPKTKCITAAVDSYLITTTPPTAGTSCPAQ